MHASIHLSIYLYVYVYYNAEFNNTLRSGNETESFSLILSVYVKLYLDIIFLYQNGNLV